MSSYLLGSARQLRSFPPSLSVSSLQRSRALHPSHRSAPNRQWPRSSYKALLRGTLFWILLTGAGISYHFHNARPLVLESEETFKLLDPKQVKRKYLPLASPFTLEHANETLRRHEDSRIVGNGSGVLRYDTVQLPSNSISEDCYFSASGHHGHEDGEIMWMLFGIYDGHA